nr:MAG TPA: hypothetical protein [Caudoviricetes sp.]
MVELPLTNILRPVLVSMQRLSTQTSNNNDMKTLNVLLAVILTAFLFSACSHKVYVPIESVSTDTLHVVSHDTIRVTERLAPVSLLLPEYHQERATKDSVSVLQNALYRSTARIHNGILTHILESLPGAKVEGLTAVHDTIRITIHDKDHKQYKEKPKIVYKEKELSWIQKRAMETGFITFGVLVILALYFVIRWKLK